LPPASSRIGWTDSMAGFPRRPRFTPGGEEDSPSAGRPHRECPSTDHPLGVSDAQSARGGSASSFGARTKSRNWSESAIQRSLANERAGPSPARGGYQDRSGYGLRQPLLVISPFAEGELRRSLFHRPVLDPPLHRGQLADRHHRQFVVRREGILVAGDALVRPGRTARGEVPPGPVHGERRWRRFARG